MCTIVNKHKESYDVDITRKDKWGNPFTLQEMQNNRELCIEYYEYYLSQQITMGKLDLSELKGKTLGCVCKPLACHGDVLREYVLGIQEAGPNIGERFIAISGSRTIKSQELVDTVLDECLAKHPKGKLVLILGGAVGVDTLALNWAKKNDVDYLLFEPDWKELGKRAGCIRNKLMHVCSHETLAIWNGVSKGTKHMIDMGSSDHPVTVHTVV